MKRKTNPPLFILPGWEGKTEKWEKIREGFAHFGFSVFVLKFPGFGEVPLSPRPWGISDYANFVLDFAQKQNLKNFFLLGHSFGGRIAIKLATNHPEKLLGLILCSAAGIKSKRGIEYWSFFSLAKIGSFLFSLSPLTLFKPFARRFLYFLVREKDYYKAKGVMRETMKKVIEEDLSPLLPKIKVPTLIVWGKEDRVTPVSDAYLMKSKISGSKLVVIESARHGLPFQKTEEFVKIVGKFCQAIK